MFQFLCQSPCLIPKFDKNQIKSKLWIFFLDFYFKMQISSGVLRCHPRNASWEISVFKKIYVQNYSFLNIINIFKTLQHINQEYKIWNKVKQKFLRVCNFPLLGFLYIFVPDPSVLLGTPDSHCMTQQNFLK